MRVSIQIPLRWGDLDAYNHVNNVAMMRILEEARVRAFWAPDSGESLPTAVLNAESGSDTITMIASHVVEYVTAVEYHRGTLDVQLWLGQIGGASADICYEVYSEGELAVRAESTMVLVNPATGAPQRFDERVRAAWADYTEAPIEFKRDARRVPRSFV